MRFSIVLVALLSVATHSTADCRIFRRVAVVEKVVPVVKAVAAVEFVTPVLPIYTVPPAYGALYYPPQVYGGAAGYNPAVGGGYQQQPGGNTGADPCAELKARYIALERRLQALEGGKPGAGNGEPMTRAEADADPPQATAGAFAGFAAKNCASCHTDATAKAKGGNFVLVKNGKVANLSAEQSGEVIRRLTLPKGHAKAMPKGGNLPADERLRGVNLFVEGDEEQPKDKK